MTGGDWIILIVLGVVLFLIFRSLKKSRSSGCHGDCTSCASTCAKIDWDKVRREVHDSRKS